ncbi:MAG TPA: chorismate-binding protein, partial [Gemmatimonadota bacterium]|nr:chorismate-binding protein [Gemmatimonadota bacterium]
MTSVRPRPDPETFRDLARPGRVVPVWIELPFDTATAVTAYAALRRPPFGFLLESVVGGERWARWTYVGSEPAEAWRLDGDRIRTWRPGAGWSEPAPTEDPFGDFGRWVGRWEPARPSGLPRFWGGAVGYFGYDTVRWLESLPAPPPGDVEVPDACFVLTDRLLIVDNLFDRALALKAVRVAEEGPPATTLHEEAVAELEAWAARLREPPELPGFDLDAAEEVPWRSNRSREDFQAAVERVREYIRAGDAYQVVVSQRLEAPLGTDDPLLAYRALRTLNPSPYLYFLELGDLRLIGSSPELLVRVEDASVTVRPIAGTRPRGSDPDEDERLGSELLADEKERSEHLMLVDLGRNDVSAVARPGSVRVPEFMTLERYSHVIHMVSEVTGTLDEGRGALDALRACFPAGTLTGAPKVRAMEIIDELEPTRRGPYGGAAGYVAFGARTLDMAIAIRTILEKEG